MRGRRFISGLVTFAMSWAEMGDDRVRPFPARETSTMDSGHVHAFGESPCLQSRQKEGPTIRLFRGRGEVGLSG